MREFHPEGLLLKADQADGYATGLIARKGASAVQALVKKWAARPDTLDVDAAVRMLWEFLTEETKLLQQGHAPLPEGEAAGRRCWQVTWRSSSSSPAESRERCTTASGSRPDRPRSAPAPATTATARRSTEQPDEENYDVWLMGRPFVMVSAEEHTAQVPGEIRNRIENDFKSKHGRTNCLVATPTLEMGVNIGALDMALMRNVPPRSANYWQRAGRAGREERMAVVVTYCRRSPHDRYFFDDPLRLLGGAIEAPTFNLRNPLMVAKHIRSAILSELLLRSRQKRVEARADSGLLEATFPDLHPRLSAGRGQIISGTADQHGPAWRSCSKTLKAPLADRLVSAVRQALARRSRRAGYREAHRADDRRDGR